MRGWGQRPAFRIRPGDEALDALLAARGYLLHDPTLILAAPAAAHRRPIPGRRPSSERRALACMAEIWAEGGLGPARLAVMVRAPEPRGFILGRRDDRPAGAGFVALHGGVAMLHALEVTPAARRGGLGAAMTTGAARWGLERGAVTFALAVTRANAPALALYRRLGLEEAGSYHYREAVG